MPADKRTKRNLFRKTRFAAYGILFSLFLWAFWLEPASIRIAKIEIDVPRWPAECSGMRVVVLADLHVGSPWNGLRNLKRIVDRTNSLKPDLVLLPGDFVIHGVLGGSFVEPEQAAEVLAGLRARLGVYAVLGNHDWWLNRDRVFNSIGQQGIAVLEDRSINVNAGGCRFALVGLSDYREGPHDIDRALANVDPLMASLAFTHNPDIFPEIPASVNLTIAGHTHGGQVYLPFIGRPVVPSTYGDRYAIGYIEENGKAMYVSSGVGTSILPVRFMVPPEITELTLHSE